MEVLYPEKWKYYPRKNKNKNRLNWASMSARSLARTKRAFFREQYFQKFASIYPNLFFRQQYFQFILEVLYPEKWKYYPRKTKNKKR